MLLKDYCQQLLLINQPRFTNSNNARYLSTICFGVVEEFSEWLEKQDDIKEVGDILAYVTLTIASIIYRSPAYQNDLSFESLSEDTSAIVNACIANFNSESAELEITLIIDFAGHIKRHFREGLDLRWSTIVSPLAFALARSGFDLGDVAQANINKLNDRAERNQLFSGSGDNR